MQHSQTRYSSLLLKSGEVILRYGLVVILIWIGILKFSAYEADGVRSLAEQSPLFSWSFRLLSTRSFSNLLGIIEVTLGLLIALRPFSAKLSAMGSIGGAATFVVTLSFLLSTPGVIQKGMSFPFLSGSPGQFLIKDIILLGASFWTAGEAMVAMRD